jgi:Tfp pilus assembly protein PilP
MPSIWLSMGLWTGVALLLAVTRGDWAYAQTKETTDTYRYNPEGKRDPFRSPFLAAHGQQQAPREAKTPLQRFDLGQLKLVGVVVEGGESKAVIEDNTGLGYIVTQGTPIGTNGGIIRAITPQKIIVEEYETDFYGKRRARQRELPLVVGDAADSGRVVKSK